MSYITVGVYQNRYGKSLCVQKPNGSGYRVDGVKMDGTNKEIAKFTVDAEKLIEAIERERWERGD